MSLYAIPLYTALFYFVLLAFLGTIPWTLFQYRKHGYFSFWRSVIFFSFIYYCLTAFFLVSLPLPTSRNNIEFKNNVHYQLHPFNMINNFKMIPGFEFNDIKTYPILFKSFTFLEVFFNMALLFPLGVYLRYFLKHFKKWYLALIITFSVTLFFEVSQLTALFGYYAYPYRLFDVDDLLMNTVGGMIGFFVAPLFLLLIPSRDDLHKQDNLYTQDKPASYGSQLLEVIINLMVAQVIGSLISFNFFEGDYLFVSIMLISFVFLVILPLMFKGGTLGGKILKIKIHLPASKRFLSLLFRFILIYGTASINKLTIIVDRYDANSRYLLLVQFILISFVLIAWFMFWGALIVDWLRKKQAPFFNRLSRIQFIRK